MLLKPTEVANECCEGSYMRRTGDVRIAIILLELLTLAQVCEIGSMRRLNITRGPCRSMIGARMLSLPFELHIRSTCSPSKYTATLGWILGLMSHPRVSGQPASGPLSAQMPHSKQQMMLRKRQRSWEA